MLFLIGRRQCSVAEVKEEEKSSQKYRTVQFQVNKVSTISTVSLVFIVLGMVVVRYRDPTAEWNSQGRRSSGKQTLRCFFFLGNSLRRYTSPRARSEICTQHAVLWTFSKNTYQMAYLSAFIHPDILLVTALLFLRSLTVVTSQLEPFLGYINKWDSDFSQYHFFFVCFFFLFFWNVSGFDLFKYLEILIKW